ncbi:MAG: hypothetical protein WC812_00020 [Candidatus Pacearchaeota archaeon]|jgi:hypothetical protein
MIKKEIFFCLIFIFLLNFSSAITGESITGNVTSQGFSLSISVVLNTPSLEINSPTNGTFLTTLNLPLNYSVSNANAVWYNLDNSLNTSLSNLSSIIYFNTSSGFHTLYLYANNSDGLISKNISFTVDSTKFIIHYNERNSNNFVSTEFNSSSYEDLQNISGVFFEQLNYGRIYFLESLNVTNTSTGNNSINLNNYINISFNRIEINSTALPNFNKSAQLKFYSLSFSNPRILKDGNVCSSEECSIVGYSSGILTFNVDDFSVYSSEETPSEVVSSGGGGGGSSKVRLKESDLVFDKDILKIDLRQGQSILTNLSLTNVGNEVFDVEIVVDEKIDFLIDIDEKTFIMNSNGQKEIPISFFSNEETIPDVYFGELMINYGDFNKEIPVIIDIDSLQSLLDVELVLPNPSNIYSPGSDLTVVSKITNFGEVGRFDVILEYEITDLEGNIILSNSDSMAVETQFSNVQIFTIPDYLKRGRYLVSVKAKYNGEVAVASHEFFVDRGLRTVLLDNLTLVVIFILLGILLILIFLIIIKCFFQRMLNHAISKEKKHISLSKKNKK